MSTPKFVLRTVALTLAALVLVFFAVGMLLADSWQIVTSRTMPLPAEPLAQRIGDLRTWEQWSALQFPLGNPTEVVYDGEAGAAGQRGIWRGPVGEAQLLLTDVEADVVRYAIGFRFGGDGEGEVTGGRYTGSIAWRQADDGDGTTVVWTENGQLHTLFDRWANWFGALQEKVKQVQGASLAGLEREVMRSARDESQSK